MGSPDCNGTDTNKCVNCCIFFCNTHATECSFCKTEECVDCSDGSEYWKCQQCQLILCDGCLDADLESESHLPEMWFKGVRLCPTCMDDGPKPFTALVRVPKKIEPTSKSTKRKLSNSDHGSPSQKQLKTEQNNVL